MNQSNIEPEIKRLSLPSPSTKARAIFRTERFVPRVLAMVSIFACGIVIYAAGARVSEFEDSRAMVSILELPTTRSYFGVFLSETVRPQIILRSDLETKPEAERLVIEGVFAILFNDQVLPGKLDLQVEFLKDFTLASLQASLDVAAFNLVIKPDGNLHQVVAKAGDNEFKFELPLPRAVFLIPFSDDSRTISIPSRIANLFQTQRKIKVKPLANSQQLSSSFSNDELIPSETIQPIDLKQLLSSFGIDSEHAKEITERYVKHHIN